MKTTTRITEHEAQTTTIPAYREIVKERSGMTVAWAIVILGGLLLLGMLAFGLATRLLTGRGSSPSAPPGGGMLPSSGTTLPSIGGGSPHLTEAEAEASSLCRNTMVGKGAGRWYMVYTSPEARQTVAARLCVGANNRFRVAEDAQVVAFTLYVREGGHEAAGNLDTGRKLSDLIPGKAYVTVHKTSGGGEGHFTLENPKLVFLEEGDHFDFCKQYKKKGDDNDPVERYIAGICFTGRSPAIAQQANQLPRVGCCPSPQERKEVMKRLEAIEEAFKAHERRPLPPSPAPPVAFTMP